MLKEFQFYSIMLMSLLTLTLVFLIPRGDQKLQRSKWMAASGTGLMALQFLLQYIFGFRQMGVTQAVAVNLLFFIPCSCLFTLTILNLQRRIGWKDCMPALISFGITLIALTWAELTDELPPFTDSPQMRIAEYIAAVGYSIQQLVYTLWLVRGSRRLEKALNNYYDNETGKMLQWMKNSVVLLALIAVGVPWVIFNQGPLLVIYSVTISVTIYYMVICFGGYCVSNDSHKVMEADKNDEENEQESKINCPTLSQEEQLRVESAVHRWVKDGKHLQCGITIKDAVKEMQIPRYLLATWLKTTEWELFNPWLSNLRIEEAMNVLRKHPDWSNDAVAQHCGFSSRSYFQQVFKKTTGKTPAQWVETLTKR